VPAEARSILQEVRLCPEEMEAAHLEDPTAEVAVWEAADQDQDPEVVASAPAAEKNHLTNREFPALIKVVRNAELKW